MRVWLVSFVILFAIARLFQWIQQLSVPLPVFILGGVILAIASNYDKRSGWPFYRDGSVLEATKIEMPSAIDSTKTPESQPVSTIWRPEDE